MKTSPYRINIDIWLQTKFKKKKNTVIRKSACILSEHTSKEKKIIVYREQETSPTGSNFPGTDWLLLRIFFVPVPEKTNLIAFRIPWFLRNRSYFSSHWNPVPDSPPSLQPVNKVLSYHSESFEFVWNNAVNLQNYYFVLTYEFRIKVLYWNNVVEWIQHIPPKTNSSLLNTNDS